MILFSLAFFVQINSNLMNNLEEVKTENPVSSAPSCSKTEHLSKVLLYCRNKECKSFRCQDCLDLCKDCGIHFSLLPKQRGDSTTALMIGDNGKPLLESQIKDKTVASLFDDLKKKSIEAFPDYNGAYEFYRIDKTNVEVLSQETKDQINLGEVYVFYYCKLDLVVTKNRQRQLQGPSYNGEEICNAPRSLEYGLSGESTKVQYEYKLQSQRVFRDSKHTS
jgi:hypothetical protein